ncbi:hypothetical protein LTR53_014551 [Teratosphaeriaceae sp. CCFEE 6253]|nr:hypothetical protein LTR53_014551 [Teratosphaeriaceae sp. CCFEE 6253]
MASPLRIFERMSTSELIFVSSMMLGGLFGVDRITRRGQAAMRQASDAARAEADKARAATERATKASREVGAASKPAVGPRPLGYILRAVVG